MYPEETKPLQFSAPPIARWFRKHISVSGAMAAAKCLSSQGQILEDVAADFCLWYHNIDALYSQTISNSLRDISTQLFKVAGRENAVSIYNQAALSTGIMLCAHRFEDTFSVDRCYAEACYSIARIIPLIRDRSLLREMATFLEKQHPVPPKVNPFPVKLLEVLIDIELVSRTSAEALGMLHDRRLDEAALADRDRHWLLFNLESTVDAAPWYQSVLSKVKNDPAGSLATLTRLLMLHVHHGHGPCDQQLQ